MPDIITNSFRSDANPSGRSNASAGSAVIELQVRNHPGAMSHITGLFARRAFNLEAILCAPNPADGGATSRMLLLVAEEPRLPQLERQLTRLHDVLAVRHRTDLDRAHFERAFELEPAAAARPPTAAGQLSCAPTAAAANSGRQ